MNKEQFYNFSRNYGLKFIEEDFGLVTLTGVTNKKYYIEGEKCNISIEKDSNFKPVLHPLSDLTNPIEHKGERFVPIVELAKLANVETIGRAEFSKQTEYQTHFYVDYINKRVRKRFQLRRLTFEKESLKLDFGYFYPYRNGFLYVDNQFILFTKLIEWHFDIAGLIEKGEAIDVNTLEINPYK